MARRLALGIILATAALGGAACGGDDDDEAGALSHEELIAQADEICGKAEEEQRGRAAYGKNLDNPRVLLRLSRASRGALEELQALEPPEEDEAEFDRVLAALERSADAFDARADALKAKDTGAQSEASREFEAAYGDMTAAAGPLGLSRCQELTA